MDEIYRNFAHNDIRSSYSFPGDIAYVAVYMGEVRITGTYDSYVITKEDGKLRLADLNRGTKT